MKIDIENPKPKIITLTLEEKEAECLKCDLIALESRGANLRRPTKDILERLKRGF